MLRKASIIYVFFFYFFFFFFHTLFSHLYCSILAILISMKKGIQIKFLLSLPLSNNLLTKFLIPCMHFSLVYNLKNSMWIETAFNTLETQRTTFYHCCAVDSRHLQLVLSPGVLYNSRFPFLSMEPVSRRFMPLDNPSVRASRRLSIYRRNAPCKQRTEQARRTFALISFQKQRDFEIYHSTKIEDVVGDAAGAEFSSDAGMHFPKPPNIYSM